MIQTLFPASEYPGNLVQTHTIAFTPELLLQAYRGAKTETRRKNAKWMKLVTGDILIPALPEFTHPDHPIIEQGTKPLFVTVAPYRHPLFSITDAQAIAEGIHHHNGLYWATKHHRLMGHAGTPDPKAAFLNLWRTIHPNPPRNDINPLVTAITFSLTNPLQPEITKL